MTIHACFKCFIYFRHTMQMFHLNISKVNPVLHMLLWLYMHVLSVSYVSDVCLQVFYLNVSKVDLGEAHVAAASVPPWGHRAAMGYHARLLVLLLVRACGLGVLPCMCGPTPPPEHECRREEMGVSGRPVQWGAACAMPMGP
jgi:hypothetical protein